MTSETNPFSLLPPSQRFARFTGEVIQIVGKMTGTCETYLIGAIDEAAMGNNTLKQVVTKVKKNADSIAKFFFTVGCAYNLYSSSICFFSGTVIGALSSASPFPIKIDSLRQGLLLGMTSDDGYAASKVMFGLATLNYYLGKNHGAFAVFTGVMTGHFLFHEGKNSFVGKVVSLIGNEAFAYTNIFFKKISN